MISLYCEPNNTTHEQMKWWIPVISPSNCYCHFLNYCFEHICRGYLDQSGSGFFYPFLKIYVTSFSITRMLGPHKPLDDTTQLTRPTYVCQSSEYAFPRKARQSNLKKKKKKTWTETDLIKIKTELSHHLPKLEVQCTQSKFWEVVWNKRKFF